MTESFKNKMKSHELKEDIGNFVSKLIEHPVSKQIKELLMEHIISLIIEELRFLVNKYFFEVETQINEAILLSIKWVLKEEYVHDFESDTLNKISTKISDPIIDKIAEKILEKTKEDLLTKEALSKIIFGIIKEIFSRSSEEPEQAPLEDD